VDRVVGRLDSVTVVAGLAPGRAVSRADPAVPAVPVLLPVPAPALDPLPEL
jgi:hypothetical protein